MHRTFYSCVGSVGRLEAEHVVKNLLQSCAGGLQKSKTRKPALKMIFPTYYDVQNSNVPVRPLFNILPKRPTHFIPRA